MSVKKVTLEHKYDEHDFSYYKYEVGRYSPYEWESEEKKAKFVPYQEDTTKLVWNIFAEEGYNPRKIKVYNLFDYCWPFLEDLVVFKRKYGKDFTKFADEVRGSLQHHYWSKSEHEIVITTWAPHIDNKELDRLNKEREDAISKGYKFYSNSVNLETEVKIDVYTQIMMNWDRFINYIWDNKRLITRKKLGLDH